MVHVTSTSPRGSGRVVGHCIRFLGERGVGRGVGAQTFVSGSIALFVFFVLGRGGEWLNKSKMLNLLYREILT